MDHVPPPNLRATSEPPFPMGGGELGTRIRHHDWSASALGALSDWPTELRIPTQNMLHGAFPQMILWGRGPWVLYNDAFRPILGSSHPGALGARFSEIWPELWKDVKPLLEEIRKSHHPRHLRTFPTDFAGQEQLGNRGYAFSITPLFLQSGQVGGISIIVAETAEDALRRSDARFRAVVEASRDIIAITAPDTRFLFLSPSAEKALKRPLKELLGTPLLDLMPPENIPKVKTLFAELGKRLGRVEEFVIPITTPSGETLWFATTACNSLMEQEGLGGILLNMRDISVLKHYEAQLVDATEHATEMARLKSNILANLSHEFQTPLTSIIGMASLLTEQVPPDLRPHAQEIERAGQRLAKTLSSVLTLAQIEGNAIQAKLQPRELHDELTQIVEPLQSEARQEGLAFQLSLPQEEIWIDVDPAFLQGVLTHLIQNAIKFTEEGQITVRLIPTDEEAVIEIEDTGVGIREEFLPTLFDEFQQESTGLGRAYEGIGLGLAIARHMLKAVNGTIEARSTPGDGSTFIIHLPRLSQPPGTAPAPPATKSTTDKPLTRPRLLAAEDEDAIRTIIEHLLSQDFDVTAVANAEAALQKAAQEQFDIVLLDIGLPGMSGVDAVHELRTLEDYAERPIVALSGYAMPDDRLRFLNEGFTEYIAKPFPPHELKDKLMKLL